jgi:hypothetical protein
MPQVTKHAPGSFCWPELATTDAEGAKAFYGGLFGWTATDSPAGPDMVYTMLKLRGLDAGALYGMDSKQQQGVPPHWNAYVAVENADESAEKAKSLGGTVVMGPFDVMDVGRMAIIKDPTGATFCLWQARKHIGVGVKNEPGALTWCELDTRDLAKAKAFYTALFGWTTKDSPEYTEWMLGGEPIGGMMSIPKEWGDVPPSWLTYFAVADADATAAKAKELGGKVIVPPMDIPGTGRFSVLADPQGAVFAVYEAETR